MQTAVFKKSTAILGVLLYLSAFQSVYAFEPVTEIPPPKAWDHFEILVWQYQTSAPRDKALYEEVNLNGFHIDRSNDALRKFADETKWPFYVDHAADKGYLHLNDNAVKGLQKKSIIARPNSLADPATMEKMKDFLKHNIAAAKGSTAVAYALDDEISLGSFCTPCEVDGSPLSLAGYRKWLLEQYPNLEALNQEYGTSYKKFDEIAPKSYEEFREQIQPNGLGKLNLSMWCDWRSYMDTQFASTIAELVKYSNTLDPATPTGFVGGQSPNAWGGYDYRKLSNAAQWMEAYDIGSSNEILRSFWSQKRPHVQTFFSSKDTKKDAWFLWYYLCHGNRGVIAWPEGWFNKGTVASHIKANAETFKEVQGPVSKLIIDGEFQNDAVAIYYSHPSIQVTWALDAAVHGGTWINRKSSMDASLSTSVLSRNAWVKTLEDIGIQPKFIHQDHLLSGELIKGKYKVLVLNRVLCLSDKEAGSIKAFVDTGGTVIADHMCGIMDEHGKTRFKGALDDLFGVTRDSSKGLFWGRTLTEVDGEKSYGALDMKNWVGKEGRQFAGVAVVETGLLEDGGKARDKVDKVPFGIKKGNAVYLNLSPIGFLLNRDKSGPNEWVNLIAEHLKEAGVTPRLHVTQNGQPAPLMESLFWKNGASTTLCLIRNINRAAKIDSFGDAGGALDGSKAKIKLTFTSPVKNLKNERTGKALGNGAEFEDDFTPWEANVYTFEP